MAKKRINKKVSDNGDLTAKHGLQFLALALLAAMGFAAIIQGILMQWSFGFKYGFFSYLLGFIFIGAAKYLKMKIYSGMCCHPHF